MTTGAHLWSVAVAMTDPRPLPIPPACRADQTSSPPDRTQCIPTAGRAIPSCGGQTKPDNLPLITSVQ